MTTSSLTESDLFSHLELGHQKIEVGAIYTHYRNKTPYKVLGLAVIEETQEVAVIYQKEPSGLTSVPWIRPVSSFLEKVETPEGLVNRFQKN